MPLILPDFSHDRLLQRVHVYASVDSPHHWQAIEKADNSNWELLAPNGSAIRFFANHDDDEGPSFVNFYLESVRTGGNEGIGQSSSINELERVIASFYGIGARALLKASYLIPKEVMPKRGIVPALRQSMMVGDSTVTVNGASVAVGGPLHSRITWQSGDDDSLSVDVTTIEDVVISDSLLLSTAALLRERLDAIVFLALPGASQK